MRSYQETVEEFLHEYFAAHPDKGDILKAYIPAISHAMTDIMISAVGMFHVNEQYNYVGNWDLANKYILRPFNNAIVPGFLESVADENGLDKIPFFEGTAPFKVC